MKLIKYIIITILLVCGLTFADDCISVSRPTATNSYSDAALNYAFNLAKVKNKTCVQLSSGTWKFNNSIVIPTQMKLKGTYNGAHNYNTNGTTIECRTGAGLDSANRDNACILMFAASNLEGINMVWPDQKGHEFAPITYPWGISCRGNATAANMYDPGRCVIKNVTMANAYNGIELSVEANDHHLENVNISAYKRGILVSNISSLGIVDNVNIDDKYMYQYYGWTNNTDAQSVMISLLYNQLIAIQYNRADWGDIKNINVNNAYIAYKFDIHQGVSYTKPYSTGVWWQNPQIYLTNANSKNCNYAIFAVTIQKGAGIQYFNANLEGKIRVEDVNWGPIHFTQSNLTYKTSLLETTEASHIHVVSRNTTLSFFNTNIITGSENPNIPFNAAAIFTSSNVALNSVTMKKVGYHTENSSQLVVYGSYSFINWTDGEIINWSKKYRQFNKNGKEESVTRINNYNVIEKTE